MLSNEEEIKLLQAYQNLRAFWYELQKEYSWLFDAPQFVLGSKPYPLAELVNQFADKTVSDMEYGYDRLLESYGQDSEGPWKLPIGYCYGPEGVYKDGPWKKYLTTEVLRCDGMLNISREKLEDAYQTNP